MKRLCLTFTTRFNLFLAAIILVSGLGTSLALTWKDLRQEYRELQRQGRILTRLAADNLRYPLLVGDRTHAAEVLESFRGLPQLAAIQVFDARCRLWLQPPHPAPSRCPPSRYIPAMSELWRSAHPFMVVSLAIPTNTAVGEQALFLESGPASQPLGYVALVFDLEGFRTRFLTSARDSLFVTLAFLIPILAISSYRSRRLTRPLERLHDALANLPAAKPQPLEVSADIPEIRLLEARFNAVQQQLAEYHQDLERLAFRDHVTQLRNRTWLQEQLPALLREACQGQGSLALLFLDLDRFKLVNDTLGHATGDQLLHTIAARLQGHLRDRDILVRLGGDEFLILLPNLASAREKAEHQAKSAAAKLIKALKQPLRIAGHQLRVSFSIGIALAPHDAEDADTLLRFADIAMYAAKDAGRQTFRLFRPEQAKTGRRRLALEAALTEAVERQRLQFFLQPQIQADGGCVCGAEVLLRWRHKDAWISPAEFIPLLEETGLIVPVSEWLVREALALKRRWLQQGLCGKGFRHLAVNISPVQLWREDFTARMLAIIRECSPDGELGLELELTESALVQPSQAVLDGFEQLKAAGVRFAIDDFGTGYSNLAYLKRFPLDAIKIDQSFVRDCIEDPADAALVTAICAMARGLGLTVVAEGVETEAQVEFLRRQHCQIYQGYLFARPMPPEEFERFLKTQAIPCQVE
ncbi:hypothetical protein MIT9_P2397 [Methylomarinovum caldicuralii]|uniref:EAL domain-containing protein n=1 Tax=Methylomarinovum caldicuralii TaxID=438856 RepID=A0AAU9C6J6_9GAMM|nr:EAL domain-containing protein [Methylomarinovum caldicuralii]BCX82809.1 hypothetical protein MIT9_P2397 [Methylomarinovum caldicuralii]